MFVRTICAALALAASSVASAQAPATPHYAIELDLDPAHHTLAADVTLRLAPFEDSAVFLLGGTYAVSAIEADNGASAMVAPPQQEGAPQTLIVSRAAAAMDAPISLHVQYSGPLSPSNGVNEVAPERVELSADSLWYPLSTNFNARVTMDAHVRGLPRNFVVASPDSVHRRGAIVHIERTLPSQDLAFFAAPGLHKVDRGDLHFFATDPSASQPRNYVANGPRALTYLRDLLGPSPRRNISVVVADRESGVGYSRPGYVIVANTNTDFAADQVWPVAGYIAHEISHAWWSNANFTDEDYWLVESTAEYVALRFIESRYGADDRQRLLDGKRERAQGSGPILGHGRASDAAVYARGPLLLFDLESQIGRPALDRMLRDLAQREHITTADFLAALRAASDAATAEAFEQRLRAEDWR